MPVLSERLKMLRISNNLTQKDVAEAINTSDRNYRRYEAGTTEPTASVLVALANFFNVSIDYLVGQSNDPTRH